MTKKVNELAYERVDIDKECEFLKNAKKRAETARSGGELVAIREEVVNRRKSYESMISLAYIRHSLNISDKFYSDEQDFYDEQSPKLSAALTDFIRALVQSPHAKELSGLINPIIYENMCASVRVMDEKIVDDCVEENKLVTEYDRLMGGLSFDWQGKRLTLSELSSYCKDKDRATRKKAFTLLGNTLKGISDSLDGIYDRMVKIRDRIAKKMGFENYVEMGDLRMGHIGYGRKEIAVFRNSVLHDAVPAIARLKHALADKLGLDKIHIYDNDNYIDGGNIDPIGSAEDLFAAAQSMYDEMNPALGAFFRSMCEAEAIDYKSRPNKEQGGYAELIYKYGQPFIFANFNGTMDDVGVLTHEFGHAYAFKRAYDNNIDLDILVGGMETAETHSMSMEALCNKFNDKFYGQRAREATYQQIFDALNFLPYGVIVDYFQEQVYSKPDMAPEKRKELWIKLESEFRPYVDMSDVPYFCDGGRWQYQRHIYEVPFYYIDYCLSTTLALQFGVLAESDYGKALNSYLNLVEAGGTKSIDVLAHEAGLMSPFDDGALSLLCEKTEEHLKKLA